MKKSLLFASALITGMCFMACTVEDNPSSPSKQEYGLNDLEVFTEQLISVDDLGQLKGVNIGMALSTVTPTIFSVKVNDLNDAKSMFMGLVEGCKDVRTSGDEITVILRDHDLNEQGKVFFKKGDGDAVATMSYEGFTLPGITELRFLTNWPVNSGGSRWKLYAVMTVPSSSEGNPRGLCIREYSEGTNGMIICPMDYRSGYEDWRVNTSKTTLHKMSDQIQKLGVDNVKNALKNANLFCYLNNWFWTTTTKFIGVDKTHYKIRLSNGEVEAVTSWEVALHANSAYNIYTYYFDENGNCW